MNIGRSSDSSVHYALSEQAPQITAAAQFLIYTGFPEVQPSHPNVTSGQWSTRYFSKKSLTKVCYYVALYFVPNCLFFLFLVIHKPSHSK